MTQPSTVLLARFRSKMSRDEVMKVAEERMPKYRALKGLVQKYYVEDPETGEIGGLYLWESPEALAEFRASELRATIAEVYQVEGEPKVEVYQVLAPLRE